MHRLQFPVLIVFFLAHFVATNKVEQVHMSLSGKMDEMVVTWLTMDPLPNVTPYVAYGTSKDNLRYTAKGKTTSWKDQGTKGVVRYTHRAVMTKMVAGQWYYYQVGSSQTMSETFHFRQPDPKDPLRVAIFGDLSTFKGQETIDHLKNVTHDDHFDIVIHIGDLAYDLHKNDGSTGDDFMNAIQPIATRVPYMVFAGNHETDGHFNHIKNRFTMPANGVNDDNLFWSVDYGAVHFVALNSEYYAEAMSKEAEAQYKWLEADLAAHRTARWTIVMFHRPWYCSYKGCHDTANVMSRKGSTGYPGLEKLLYDNKVDFVFYGHKHTYERMWPIYDGTPYKSSNPALIHNAKAPVYTMTGAAGGGQLHQQPSEATPEAYSVTRLGQNGYTRLKVYNASCVSTYFVDTSDKIGNYLDGFYLVKN